MKNIDLNRLKEVLSSTNSRVVDEIIIVEKVETLGCLFATVRTEVTIGYTTYNIADETAMDIAKIVSETSEISFKIIVAPQIEAE